jgi:hypothetical protein
LDPSIATRPRRNEACHCGSERKYKQCCLSKDEAADRAARAKAAESAPAPAAEEASATAPAAQPAAPRPATKQPWKKGSTNTRGFQRMSAPRKVGSG